MPGYYTIRMGIPEMKELWDSLTSNDPGLQTHEISPLTKRYGVKVWQSYLENRKSSSMRMYWVYGPGKMDITVIGLEPHPEDKKKGGYNKVVLSDME